MDITYLIARRIKKSSFSKSNVSSRIIKIAILAVGIGITSIIIAFSTGRGLQKSIYQKTAVFNGDVVISTFENNSSRLSLNPIKINENFSSILKGIKNIKTYQNTIYKAGLIKFNDNFEGIVFKGIDSTFNKLIFSKFIIEGRFPNVNKKNSNEIIVSQILANKLNLKIGDEPITFFKKDNTQAIPNQRKFKVVGIYNSDFTEFDDLYIIGSLNQIRIINKWLIDQVGSVEVFLNNSKKQNETAANLYTKLPPEVDVITLKSRFENLFQWIALFDLNIFIILSIMLFVGFINVTTALLILIFERSSMIGLLKTFGALDIQIQKIFMFSSFDIIIKGTVLGNILGLGFYFSQKYLKWIKLDPTNYYVSSAPVEISLLEWMFINLSFIIICLILLWFPSKIISGISPSKNIRKS